MRLRIALLLCLALAACGARHSASPHITRGLAVNYAAASTLTVGESLYASTGSWPNGSSTFTYQWRDCDAAGANCVNAGGSPSTNRIYTLVAGDAGSTIRVAVTGNNGGTQTSPRSGLVASAAAAAPVNTIAPYFCGSAAQTGCSGLTGQAIVGQTLSVNDGTWTCSGGCGALSYAYQWERCTMTDGQPPTAGGCAAIVGATGESYAPVAADQGKALMPIITASNGATASTPTSLTGTCAQGEMPLGSTAGNQTNMADPSLIAGCSPLSAAVSSNGTWSGITYCTNSVTTCGYGDPLNQTVGPPTGTTLSTVTDLNCSNATFDALNVTGSVTINSGCTITNSRLPAFGLPRGSLTGIVLSHDDIAGPWTGNWWNPTCTWGGVSGSTGTDISLYTSLGHYTGAFNYYHCSSEALNGGNLNDDHSFAYADECWGPCSGGAPTHDEGIYLFGGSTDPSSVTWTVALNGYGQTAGAFLDGGNGGQQNVTLDHDLFATQDSNGDIVDGNCTQNSGNVTTNNRASKLYGTNLGGWAAFGTTASTGNILDDTAASWTAFC